MIVKNVVRWGYVILVVVIYVFRVFNGCDKCIEGLRFVIFF